ncbi:MAG: DUF677 domain-containing protein [Oscillospiraceae bacterium]|nr:DUF677 domain-containing protein [Oscillospiraceae bacterium]
MSDKIKKALPYMIVNLIGTIIFLLCSFIPQVTYVGFWAALITYAFLQKWFTYVILIVLNIFSFVAVIKNKPILGVLLSLPLGSMGAFIGTVYNESFKCIKTVKVVSLAHIWLVICCLLSFIMAFS